MKHLLKFARKRSIPLIALAFFIANVLIRLPLFQSPNRAVFDEAHFATYAADYAARDPHIDIHPPLGGMLYSIPLALFSPKSSYEDVAYVEYNFGGEERKAKEFWASDFGTFPYHYLRLVSIFFAGILAVGIFLFTHALSGKLGPAILAVSLATLENALIFETRFILLNGMFLAFGFFGLYFLLKNRTALSGILIGLSISVKLIGGIFGAAGLVWISMQNKRDGGKRFLVLLASAIAIFLTLTLVVENLWVPMEKKDALFEKTIYAPLASSADWKPPATPNEFERRLFKLIPSSSFPYLKSTVMQSLVSLGGYTIAGGATNSIESAWYGWPFMIGVFPYYFGFGNVAAPTLVLMGNPLIWGLGTAAVLIGMKRIFQRKQRKRKGEDIKERDAVEFLTYSYLMYLAFFLLFVRRDAFMYHYFPALIISIILFSVLFSEFAETKPKRTRFWLYASIFSLSALGFVLIAPFTYGVF